MSDITITLTEIVDGVSAESTPASVTVSDGIAGVLSVVAGANVTVDSTDPHNPVVSATGGGGSGTGIVDSVVAGAGISVDGTDPANPVITNTGATAAQGTLADSAVQPGDLATVATTGAYSDLTGKPTLGTAAAQDSTAFDAAGAAAAAQAASQPLDSDLTAIAALTTTAFGRALLALADAAALRSTAGLGDAATHAAADFDAAGAAAAAQAASQPLDSELSAIAGLVSAADKLPYFTGSGTASLTTLSAFIRSLLDDADAATARGTLGLGTAATTNTGTGATNVILGNDSRLSDARTPTAHASTHASAGSDPITIAESQVTNLTTDLAAKAPLASPAFTGHPSVPDVTYTEEATPASPGAGTQRLFIDSTDHKLKRVNSSGTVTTVEGSGSGLTDPTTTKGDLLVRGASSVGRHGVGSDGQALIADSTQSDGVKWAFPSMPLPPWRTGLFYCHSLLTNHTTSTAALTTMQSNGNMHFIPIIIPPGGGTIDQIVAEVTATGAGASVRLGIYDSDSTGAPRNRLVDAGTVDASATGARAATLGTAQALTPGVYWLAYLIESVGGTWRSSTGSILGGFGFNTGVQTTPYNRLAASGVATGSLPSTAPSLSPVSDGNTLRVLARAA